MGTNAHMRRDIQQYLVDVHHYQITLIRLLLDLNLRNRSVFLHTPYARGVGVIHVQAVLLLAPNELMERTWATRVVILGSYSLSLVGTCLVSAIQTSRGTHINGYI